MGQDCFAVIGRCGVKYDSEKVPLDRWKPFYEEFEARKVYEFVDFIRRMGRLEVRYEDFEDSYGDADQERHWWKVLWGRVTSYRPHWVMFITDHDRDGLQITSASNLFGDDYIVAVRRLVKKVAPEPFINYYQDPPGEF